MYSSLSLRNAQKIFNFGPKQPISCFNLAAQPINNWNMSFGRKISCIESIVLSSNALLCYLKSLQSQWALCYGTMQIFEGRKCGLVVSAERSLAVPKNQISAVHRKPKSDLVHSSLLCCTVAKHPLPKNAHHHHQFALLICSPFCDNWVNVVNIGLK